MSVSRLIVFVLACHHAAVIKKYSNFVGFPVTLNGKQINELQPLWLMDPKAVTDDQYDEFFRYVTNTTAKPAYTIHYKVIIGASLCFANGPTSN